MTNRGFISFCLFVISVLPFAGSRGADIKHPVLDHDIEERDGPRYEEAVARVLAMSDEELVSFVPEYGYISFCECPNCYGGVQGNGIFRWTIDRPDELKCRYCGQVAYPNSKYREQRVLAGKNSLGEEIRLPYYFNEAQKVTHFFSTHVLAYKRAWLLEQSLSLGKAYQTTGKEKYARRVVLVLDRCAQVYPHYPALHNRSCRNVRFCKSQQPPFAWDAGRWGYFHNEIPKRVIAAYDLVYESPEFDRLSAERGYDVRERLERDFLRKTYEVAASSSYIVGNVVGYDVTGVAILGKVINEPSYVHRSFGWMKRNVNEGFFCDGMWRESPSYHYMTVGGLRRAFSTVRGYSDPPGYVDAIDGTRFDDLDPESEVPFWAKVQHAPEVVDFPNGCSTPVHDTWPGQRRSHPRSKTFSTIAPGYGHASLGRGADESQMQAQLHFSGTYGHSHLDNLNLTLFANGSEMLSDLGYTWTQMRYWCVCTLGHNTVVVDRTDQNSGKSDGDLLWYFPDVNGVSVVAADGKRGYREIKGLDRYQRMLATIPVSQSDAYVVDVFRVRGGTIHDWALHGDADEDTIAACSVPLEAPRKWLLEAGEQWDEPTIQGGRFNPYGMVRDARRGEASGVFRTDFAYAKTPRKGVRVHMIACSQPTGDQGGMAEVWLGRAPSVRRMGTGTGGDMRKAYDFWMPQLLVRRRGEAPLASTFAAVEEPFLGDPFVKRVERLTLTPSENTAVALRVTHAAGVDTIISTLDAPPYPERVTSSGITMRGRLAIVRQAAGKATAAWLFEGQELSVGGRRIKAQGRRHEGRIVDATRKSDGAEQDAFVVDADLPAGESLRGVWMIVTHGNGFTHGYEIERVETQDGKTVIVLTHDHGLRIDDRTTTEVYFPGRTIKGQNSFVIPLARTALEPD